MKVVIEFGPSIKGVFGVSFEMLQVILLLNLLFKKKRLNKRKMDNLFLFISVNFE